MTSPASRLRTKHPRFSRERKKRKARPEPTEEAAMRTPLIINFAPTGMIPTKEMTPQVPDSDSKKGRPTYKDEVYAAIDADIRKSDPTLILRLSLSGRDLKKIKKRAE